VNFKESDALVGIGFLQMPTTRGRIIRLDADAFGASKSARRTRIPYGAVVISRNLWPGELLTCLTQPNRELSVSPARLCRAQCVGVRPFLAPPWRVAYGWQPVVVISGRDIGAVPRANGYANSDVGYRAG
jgi:hypothetical protein